ncbi:MAG: 23S rRNA (guanosine(2251)-2'-O)-methyltransferase RlmB [Candidatus Sericytochromatia bacterium]
MSKDSNDTPSEFQRIYGKHPVREALASERPVYKVWISQGMKPVVAREFQYLARERQVPVQMVPNQKLNQMLGDVNHQGVMADTGGYDYADWDSWLKELQHKVGNAETPDPFVLVLDQIQDPHNLGAILRTAEAAGVHGVVLPRHESVGLSETVAKSSAGAIEVIPVLQVTNLARALDELKEAGLWIMGLSANAGQSHFQTNLKGPLALVIGNEHKGLRPNVEKHCDVTLHIPMQSTRSLNASVAAGVAMYEVVRQRLSTPKG